MAGALGELGWLAPVLVSHHTGRLVDGHMRVRLALARGEAEVPVVRLDLSEEEEDLALATLDPIGEMAGRDRARTEELLASVSASDANLLALLEALRHDARAPAATFPEPGSAGDSLAAILDGTELRPSWRFRKGVGFLAVRRWREGRKERSLAALKALKAAPSPGEVAAIAEEVREPLARTFRLLAGAVVVAPPARDPSRPHLASLVAAALADLVGGRFVDAFRARPRARQSHPRHMMERAEPELAGPIPGGGGLRPDPGR